MLKIFRIFYLTFSLSLLFLPTCLVAMDGVQAPVPAAAEQQGIWGRFKSGVSGIAGWTSDKILGVDDEVPENWWEYKKPEVAPKPANCSMPTRVLNGVRNFSRKIMAHDSEANDVASDIDDEILRSTKLSVEEQGEYDAYKKAISRGIEPAEHLKKWKMWDDFVKSGPAQPTDADWIIYGAKTAFKAGSVGCKVASYIPVVGKYAPTGDNVGKFVKNWTLKNIVGFRDEDISYVQNNPDVKVLFEQYPQLNRIIQGCIERYNPLSDGHDEQDAQPDVQVQVDDPEDVVHFGDVVKIIKKMAAKTQDDRLSEAQKTAAVCTELKELNTLFGATNRIDDYIASSGAMAQASYQKVLAEAADIADSPSVAVDVALDAIGKVGDVAAVAVDKGLQLAAQAGEFVEEAKTKQNWQAFWTGLSVAAEESVDDGEADKIAPQPCKKAQLFLAICKIANKNPRVVGPMLDNFYNWWFTKASGNNDGVWNFVKGHAKDGVQNILRDGINRAINGDANAAAGGADIGSAVQKTVEEFFFDVLVDLEGANFVLCKKYGQGPADQDLAPKPGKIRNAYEKVKIAIEGCKNFLGELDVAPEESAVLGKCLRSWILERGLLGDEEELDRLLIRDAPVYSKCLKVITAMEAEKTPEERAADEELAASVFNFEKPEKSSSWLGDMNKPLFEIPVFDHLSLVLYKKDVAQFFIRILDHYVDKMFFNQINEHYHKKVCSNLALKKKKLIAILDACSKNGELDVARADTMDAAIAQKVFINHCAGVLNAGRTNMNLKWILQISLHLFLKHMVYKAECAVNPSNPVSSLLNRAKGKPFTVPEALKNLTITNAFNWACDYGAATGNDQEQAMMVGQLKEDSFNAGKKCLGDWYKNYKYKASIYPLVELFCFGNTRMLDFRVEQFYLNSLLILWVMTNFMNFKFNCPPDWLTNWFTELPYVGSAFRGIPAVAQQIPFFGKFAHPVSGETLVDWASSDSVCFMIRVALLARFLQKMNNIYQAALKDYIKENIYLFVKTISDMKSAEFGENDISFQDIVFKDMIKKAHSSSFDAWRNYKQYNATGFFGIGAALSLAGIGVGVFSCEVS